MTKITKSPSTLVKRRISSRNATSQNNMGKSGTTIEMTSVVLR